MMAATDRSPEGLLTKIQNVVAREVDCGYAHFDETLDVFVVVVASQSPELDRCQWRHG